MKYNRDFCYNQDFEWYETKVLVSQEQINLFVPGYVKFNLSLLYQRFTQIVSWIKQNRTLINRHCFKKLSHHIPGYEEKPHLEKGELTLLSLSIEKGNAFELLLESETYQKYIILLFDRRYELLDCRIDF